MKSKAFIIVFCAFLVFIILASVLGMPSTQYLPDPDFGYEITAYDVSIDVKEDKSMRITENITANFSSRSHGIVRYLPVSQTVSFYNENGKLISKNYKNEITNFDYNKGLSTAGTNLVDVENSNGYEFYYLGNESQYVIGEQNYVFSYTFDPGNDRDTQKDLYYFNIIGTGWDTTVKNVTFDITFPTEIEAQDFKFYVGQYGQDKFGDTSRVQSVVSGKTISGSCQILSYGEALTIYSQFEEGYFAFEQKSYLWDTLLLLLFFVLLISIVLFFVINRRKTPLVETVEFKAPKGLTPTEVGYINDGQVTGDDISALIVYWASKGYVRLVEKGKEIVIERNVDAVPDLKEHEKILYTEIFKNGDSISSKRLDNLSQDTGYLCKKDVIEKSKGFFKKGVDGFFIAYISLAIVLLGLMVFKDYLQSFLFGWNLVLNLVMLLVFAIALAMVDVTLKNKDKLSRKKFSIYLTINLIFVFAPLIVLMFAFEAFNDPFGIRFYFAVLPILLVLIYNQLERYTEKGKTVLGQIRGLKNYILVAEKDKMEMLVKENPSLFYEVLPYAYVLGVSDVYMDRFKDVEISAPEWYVSSNPFSIYASLRILDVHLRALSLSIAKGMARKVVSSTVSTISKFSGGGGSFGGGGGGFSGGGSGGGGGGRW